MKTKLLLVMMLFCSSYIFSQSVFVVQGTNSSSAHQSLEAAVDAASDGDYIYLPGGSFDIGSLKISKQLHLIGAGHYADSTQATGRTLLAGKIYFKTGASFSTLQGIYLSENIYMGDSATTGVVSNILISRCNIENMYMSYTPSSTNRGASNIMMRECIIRNYIYGSNTQGAVIENSIIEGTVRYFNGNAQFNNNIFLYTSSTSYGPFDDVYNCSFKNNILKSTGSAIDGGSNNTFDNCIFVASSLSSSYGFVDNCKFGVAFTNLFVNVPNIATFDYSYDYHLSEASLAKGAGTNGTDCGIYGGENPYKEGAVPMNPHIQFKSIPTTTDNEGKLNIQIKVSAQEK